MQAVLNSIEESWLYLALLFFFGLYPVISSAMWSVTALIYFFRREYHKPIEVPREDDAELPPVSILISCYCEEEYIAQTIRGLLRLDYPDYEIVIVDDGSTDRTIDAVLPFVERGQVRLIAKAENEGKAMALNDAIPMLRGEIVMIMDADAFPVPEMLRFVVPHFESARVAAVTGNPRVIDRDTLMAKLQVMEFTSIVSLQRRAQRVWGRILTVSGVVMAFRKDALIDVGLFSPDMATEDIDMTWKLQKRYYDIRYEPQALVWMRVPRGLRALWRQRRRWALGLAQVLRRHVPEVVRWRRRRMWPVLLESTLSITWAYTFVLVTGLFAISYAIGRDPVGGLPDPELVGHDDRHHGAGAARHGRAGGPPLRPRRDALLPGRDLLPDHLLDADGGNHRADHAQGPPVALPPRQAHPLANAASADPGRAAPRGRAGAAAAPRRDRRGRAHVDA